MFSIDFARVSGALVKGSYTFKYALGYTPPPHTAIFAHLYFSQVIYIFVFDLVIAALQVVVCCERLGVCVNLYGTGFSVVGQIVHVWLDT